MRHLVVDPHRPDASVVRQAADIILAGGVVAYATDTLYGLAVDPGDERAVERLFEIKQRAGEQAIPLIAADVVAVEGRAGSMTPMARRLASRFWPGPLTLVIEALPGVSPSIHRGSGRVAVRVPAHGVARLLAAASGGVITSTSANLSGAPAPARVEDVAPLLRDRLDAILDSGPAPGGPPSTIVDVAGGAPALLREGVVAWARVLECL